MNRLLIAYILMVSIAPLGMIAQDETGPQLPIVLEFADSLVGRGTTETEERAFLGNVRFRQGNVTVRADRAVQHVGANRVDLLGRVRVTQGSLMIEAPSLTYDGTTNIAVARNGATVRDGARTVRSNTARYSAKTHVVRFSGDVRMQDVSLRMVADSLDYERDTDQRLAWGNVAMADQGGASWLQGDSVLHDAGRRTTTIVGNARIWQHDGADSLFVQADRVVTERSKADAFVAVGDVSVVRGTLSARADSILYDELTGLMFLHRDPVVWSDSTMLRADAISLVAPERLVRSIVGAGNAFMTSRTDTAHADRFDQLRGDSIVFTIDQDTVRMVEAVGNTQSLYFGTDDGEPQGLAQFASDTTRILFHQGTPDDVIWLGGIRGEHHPESVVAGRPATYRLPGFLWRDDRPRRTLPPDIPFLRTGSM